MAHHHPCPVPLSPVPLTVRGILHDGQPLSVARVPQLIERFGAVDVRGTPLVAMLLLAKSSYLVGNPASTFSVNMADIRRASGAAEASTTLRYGHYWDV